MTPSDDPVSDFLYPFLQDTGEQLPLERVLAEVRGSTRQKAHEIASLRQAFFDQQAGPLVAAAQALAAAFARGATLFAFGNGGSATDAQDLAADFLNPPPGYPRLPAVSLTNDIGVVTAVGNDVGFDNVFVRQLIALARPGDVAVGFSTSGQSPNILAALQHAKKMGLVTMALAGYDGGPLAGAGLDFCLVARHSYIPRIQEVHATIYHSLWELTHALLADPSTPAPHGALQ